MVSLCHSADNPTAVGGGNVDKYIVAVDAVIQYVSVEQNAKQQVVARNVATAVDLQKNCRRSGCRRCRRKQSHRYY